MLCVDTNHILIKFTEDISDDEAESDHAEVADGSCRVLRPVPRLGEQTIPLDLSIPFKKRKHLQ